MHDLKLSMYFYWYETREHQVECFGQEVEHYIGKAFPGTLGFVFPGNCNA